MMSRRRGLDVAVALLLGGAMPMIVGGLQHGMRVRYGCVFAALCLGLLSAGWVSKARWMAATSVLAQTLLVSWICFAAPVPGATLLFAPTLAVAYLSFHENPTVSSEQAGGNDSHAIL